MKKTCILLLLLLAVMPADYAQTPEDSVKIVTANWSPRKVKKGVVYKHAPFKYLYGVAQNVNILEVTPGKKHNRVGLIVNEPQRKTSESANSVDAVGAINGSYYNMKNGKSVCFLKIGPEVIDSTTHFEFGHRVTGAVRLQGGKLALIPWNKSTEKGYSDKQDIVLASGPLMLKDGKECDFSVCDSAFIYTRHPRSAIGITNQGRILFVTVDGRFPNQAVGMSIPELTYLMKLLGCTTALNLDGGGSTTLWADLPEGTGVLNMPYDNKKFDHAGERKVANVLYIK